MIPARFHPRVMAALATLVVATLAAQLGALALTSGRWPSLAAVVAMLVPLALGMSAAALYLRHFVLSRVQNVTRALATIAEGDFSVRLGEPPSEEFHPIRESFSRMALALDSSRRRLADADARRRRLFADLAHELATPASTVLALADTFAQPELVPDQAAWRGLTEALAGEAQLLSRLVGDVRDLAVLEDPDVTFVLTPADLRGPVARAVEAARATALAPVTLAVPEVPLRSSCDAARIEQLVRIIVANATRYTPHDGTVSVTLARVGGTIDLVVDDSGPGVPDTLLERLGERLFRVDPSRDRRTGGHGLGLAIARRIAARHDGEVAFERSPLGGLRVTVTLPHRA